MPDPPLVLPQSRLWWVFRPGSAAVLRSAIEISSAGFDPTTITPMTDEANRTDDGGTAGSMRRRRPLQASPNR
jgi:hypothetical protein